ncbi:MAG: SDR family oxidoreductase [Syntrophorhabdaceae bacterium]|nr:SDR family oxidoreductase [Syntrophorhabdaceae bacterium]
MKNRARNDRKVALVTGGGQRIGAAICAALGEAGYIVVPTWLSSRREAEALASEWGGKSFRLNLSRPETFRRFAGRLASEYGRLDLLVHNASVFPRTPFTSVSSAVWDTVFAVNLRGPSFLTRAFLPLMSSSPEGAAVCFIGDAAASKLWPSYLPYCLSKIALEAFAKGLEKTIPPGIRVGVVRPGLVLPRPGFSKAQWERLRHRNTGGIRTVEGISRAVLQFANL